ncbi:hypothetical protein [Chitinophaga filiformis]|uniref:Uncharacterized protein n=1 Tax=Chitinophaga filiformis TaxID=104663 RepID=A0A1G7VW99_CHIFI|nr:hypothetical protein [Chitinophaga filiformis]SDG63828.1 hypothetical protein SAMN04488121_105306 [Chitinophaga filiformis]
MTEIRFSWLKVLPLVFLTALVSAGIQMYHNLYYDFNAEATRFDGLQFLVFLIKNAVLWAAMGLAFRTVKPATLAFGVSLIIYFTDFFLNKHHILEGSVVLTNLHALFFNSEFLPALVFAFICFKKQSLRYFWPVWVFAAITSLLFYGSAYLDRSPYNVLFRYIRLNDLFSVPTGENTYRSLNVLMYVAHPAIQCGTYILYATCYMAAINKRSWKQLFRIDLSTHYTKPAALSIFYALRFLINLLIVGLFSYPAVILSQKYQQQLFNGHSLLLMILGMAGALTFLVAVTLYYRKFLLEYFSSNQIKISWLYWIVNLPIVGMLVFPFVVLFAKAIPEVEERTRFFYYEAQLGQKAGSIMFLMLLFNFIGMWIGEGFDVLYSSWIMWLIDSIILVIYCVSVRGYYFFLGTGWMAMLVYSGILAVTALKGENYFDSASPFTRSNATMWLTGAFTVVQFVVMLPIFHIEVIKTEQTPKGIDETVGEVAGYSNARLPPPNLLS